MKLITKSLCCKPSAFNLMRNARDRIKTLDGLIDGAMAVALHGDSCAEIDARQFLKQLSEQVRSRVYGSQPQAMIAHLHDVLFVDRGLIGNTLDYHAEANSYLPAVLDTGRGLPITLSLIYYIVGTMVGLNVRGIGLPGHFCVGVELDGKTMIVDPFCGGRVLNIEEAQERIRETYGPDVEWTDELLVPVSHRHWVTRIMQNLLHTYGNWNRLSDMAAMLELELLLWPEQTHLQRDLGLVYARAGHVDGAREWLTAFLVDSPHDSQRTELEALIDVLTV